LAGNTAYTSSPAAEAQTTPKRNLRSGSRKPSVKGKAVVNSPEEKDDSARTRLTLTSSRGTVPKSRRNLNPNPNPKRRANREIVLKRIVLSIKDSLIRNFIELIITLLVFRIIRRFRDSWCGYFYPWLALTLRHFVLSRC